MKSLYSILLMFDWREDSRKRESTICYLFLLYMAFYVSNIDISRGDYQFKEIEPGLLVQQANVLNTRPHSHLEYPDWQDKSESILCHNDVLFPAPHLSLGVIHFGLISQPSGKCQIFGLTLWVQLSPIFHIFSYIFSHLLFKESLVSFLWKYSWFLIWDEIVLSLRQL